MSHDCGGTTTLCSTEIDDHHLFRQAKRGQNSAYRLLARKSSSALGFLQITLSWYNRENAQT